VDDPDGRLALGLLAFPLGRAAALVVDAEEPGWEPPSDRSADCGAAAPAVGVTAALAVMRVVYPPNQSPAHVCTVRRVALPGRGSAPSGTRTPNPLIKSHGGDVLAGDAQVQLVPAEHDLSEPRAGWCRWVMHEP
jgi:hypothetical protein